MCTERRAACGRKVHYSAAIIPPEADGLQFFLPPIKDALKLTDEYKTAGNRAVAEAQPQEALEHYHDALHCMPLLLRYSHEDLEHVHETIRKRRATILSNISLAEERCGSPAGCLCAASLVLASAEGVRELHALARKATVRRAKALDSLGFTALCGLHGATCGFMHKISRTAPSP